MPTRGKKIRKQEYIKEKKRRWMQYYNCMTPEYNFTNTTCYRCVWRGLHKIFTYFKNLVAFLNYLI